MTKLNRPPIPGTLGKKIFTEISQEKWNEWTEHQIKLINELHLNMAKSKDRQLLIQKMQKFLFPN